MNVNKYYTSGEFAKKARVTLRTIRFYDTKHLLPPTYISPSGARYYTDSDFVKLQQILLLKYLGFSLNDIKEMLITNVNPHFILDSLSIQRKLITKQLEQMQLVAQTLDDTIDILSQKKVVDWEKTLDLIHLTSAEKNIKKHYENASNLNARILLHKQFSTNTQGWFPWLFQQYAIASNVEILEIGCGDGTLWNTNLSLLPKQVSIHLTDISAGMVSDAKHTIGVNDPRFHYKCTSAEQLPYTDASFDFVVANHVLFYSEDINQVLQEISRVLKPGGVLFASAYGSNHLQEITSIVQSFDERVVLSTNTLYTQFGKENGAQLLSPYFKHIKWKEYEDSLYVTSPDALVTYVLSCHGNQSELLLKRYNEFLSYVTQITTPGVSITKEAGTFIAKK